MFNVEQGALGAMVIGRFSCYFKTEESGVWRGLVNFAKRAER